MPYDGKNWPQNETARILQDAANYIKRYGWTQGGKGIGPNGERCINMAINAVDNNSHDYYWGDAAIKAVHQMDNLLGGFAPRWNDVPGRTKEEVIVALESAAKMVEEKELV